MTRSHYARRRQIAAGLSYQVGGPKMRRSLVILSAAMALSLSLFAAAVLADISGFIERVSPDSETNATEPSIAIDRSDGTIYVAWQASGSHVARSDDGGRTFIQKPEIELGHDLGDVDIRVGGPTVCTVPPSGCVPGAHRVYVSSLERLP